MSDNAYAETLFSTMLKMDHKELFIDLKNNSRGTYLKLSERTGQSKCTVLIPASGISRLISVLSEASDTAVKHTAGTSRGQKKREEESATDVFVSGLSWKTSEQDLRTLLTGSSGVLSISLLRKNRGGKNTSLGCAVVKFVSAVDAQTAMTRLNNSELDGRRLNLRPNRPKAPSRGGSGKDSPGGSAGAASAASGVAKSAVRDEPKVLDPLRVFVSSLSWDTTEGSLAEFFEQAGPVVAVNILSSKNGRRRLGHGIVTFENPVAAKLSIEALNGRELDGRILVVREYYTS